MTTTSEAPMRATNAAEASTSATIHSSSSVVSSSSTANTKNSEEALLLQLDREQKIVDGAQHILAVETGDDQLRVQVQNELKQAKSRISRLREKISIIQSSSMANNLANSTGSAAGASGQDSSPFTSNVASVSSSSQKRIPALFDLSTYGESEQMIEDKNGREAQKRQAINLMQALCLTTGVKQTNESKFQSKPTELPTAKLSATSIAHVPSPLAGKPSFQPPVMGPPTTPSTTRQAHRARSAAIQQRPQHIRTPSHMNGLGGAAHRQIDLLTRLTILLTQNVRLRYDCPVEILIEATLPCLADSVGKEVRATAYRALRHAVVRPPWPFVQACRKRGLDLYIIRTFSRDARFTIEKEQALKLTRCIMECASLDSITDKNDEEDSSLISIGVIRAMCAALEHGEERLRILYIETLAELALHDVGLLIRSGAMRVLLNAAGDTGLEIQPELMAIMLHLADLPATRSYFRPRYDLISCLSGFTDANESLERIRGTSLATSMLFTSWTGVLYMCLDNQSAIKSIISALRVNPIQIQEEILTTFHKLFDLRKGLFEKISRRQEKQKEFEIKVRSEEPRLNLIDSYLLLIVTILLDNDIMGALIHVVQDREQIAPQALSLMQKLVNVTSTRLPNSYSLQMHSLSEIFTSRLKGESQQDHHEERERASKILQILDKFFAQQSRQQTVGSARPRADSVLPTSAPVQVDDNAFRSLLLEANVLNSKDQAKWNLDALNLLFENVLKHPKRLEEAMRASKLVKRVLAFFHPFAMRYSSLTKSTTGLNQRYTKLGCLVLQTLLSNQDGVKFLIEDRLVREIAESLETDIMSEQRLEDTMSSGYFEFIGVLSKNPDGIVVMSQSRLFTTLFKVIDRRGRLDLARLLLQHLDFSQDGLHRVLLSRMLAHRSRKLRIETMQKLAEMIKQKPNQWHVRLLVSQLYDHAAVVRNLASDFLLQACTSSTATLDMVVAMRPMLPSNGAQSLLLKFVSTTNGLRYLMQGDYIDREMDEWFHEGNHLYANRLEAMLCQTLDVRKEQFGQGTKSWKGSQSLNWDGICPPHFYGELVKTAEGCALLERKGHFADFARFIVQHADEESDWEVLRRMKSILWAVGNIGANKRGIQFLEAEDLIATIVRMAENTKVLSLRGTCFFVCGLIATDRLGAELLQDAGWKIARPSMLITDEPFGSCLPSITFLNLPLWTVQATQSNNRIPAPKNRLERNVMQNLSSLGNAIVATKASRALLKLKERHPNLFYTQQSLRKGENSNVEKKSNPISIEIFARVLHLLEIQPLRQSVRKYIWELFEVKMDDQFVQSVLYCKERLINAAKRKESTSVQSIVNQKTIIDPSNSLLLQQAPQGTANNTETQYVDETRNEEEEEEDGYIEEEDEEDEDEDSAEEIEVDDSEDGDEDEEGLLMEGDHDDASQSSSEDDDMERMDDDEDDERERKRSEAMIKTRLKKDDGRRNIKKIGVKDGYNNGLSKTYLRPKILLVGGFVPESGSTENMSTSLRKSFSQDQ